ncbi:MAG: mechanosensitive ion channel domain-containing protein [Gemmatimonadales bacterium]
MFWTRRASASGLILFFASALLVAPAMAQITTDSAPPPSGAPVVYGTDTLFTLYGRLGPFGPPERASAVVQRLARRGAALANGRDSILVTEVERRSELLIGDEVLMTVLDADALPTGQPRPALATAWAARMQQAVVATAAASSFRSLSIDAAKAALATLVLIGLLFGLQRLFHRVYRELRGPRVPPFRIKRFELLSAARLGEALTLVARVVRVSLTVLLLYIYVPLVLSFFPWTAPYSRRIVGYVLTPLHAVGAGFLDYLPNIFFLLVIFLVTRYLLKLIHLVFRAIGSGALVLEGFHRDWAQPTFNIIRFLVVAFAVVVMFPYLPGAESPAFKGVSLFVGVLFSLGSTGAVGQIVAGVVLTYTNAFRLGDRVQIGETVGDVVQRTMLVTRIRTIKNVEVTVPNATVLSSQLINFTTQASERGLILHTTVTIGYDAPWRQVHELLIAAARATGDIKADPAPFVLQTSLDDFYVSYQINAFTDQPAVMARIYSVLHQNIQDKFNEAGVEIMSPHYGARRDGNQVTIPVSYLPGDYRAPAFRVEHLPPDGQG